MRYWVYKDAQITGPLAREDLAQGRLRPDTLVCAEGASGGRDMDWRCVEEVPELSGLYLGAGPPIAGLDLPGSEYSLLERLQFETIGMDPGVVEGDWLSGVFGPAALKGEGLGMPGGLAEELLLSQKRVRDLTEQLDRLTRGQGAAQVPGLASRPHLSAPGRTPEATSLQLPSAAEIAALQKAPLAPAPTAEAPAPPAEPVMPPLPVPSPEDAAPLPAAPREVETAPTEEKSPVSESVAPPGEGRNILKMPQLGKKGVKLGAAKSFRPVGKKDAPALSLPAAAAQSPSAAPPAFEWNPPPSPQPGLPSASSAPVLQPPPVTAQGPAVAPPATMSFGLQPPPITAPGPSLPVMSPSMPSGVPPATMAYSAGGPLPSPASFFSTPGNPIPPAEPAVPAGGPATKEVLARLAKPSPAAITAAPKPKRGGPPKAFIIISIILMGAISVGGWFFLRDNKGMKSAVNMGGDQAPLGAGAEEEQRLRPVRPASEPPPAPPPTPVPVAPAAVQDERPAAIEMVKGYPLDGDRGTIGRWLQFSYTANPGFNEKWDAGAVEASTYLVQYTVQSTGKNMGQAVTYLFEADVMRKTVKGKNPQARDLLAGGGKPAAKPLAKHAPKRRQVRRMSATAAGAPARQLPLLPLPSDTDLLPPSEDDAAFHSDTVQPGL